MRETKNLKLSQFDPNDVPNWLDQYNTDMEKIDAANGSQSATNAEYDTRFTTDEELINNNRTQINENTQDIANIKDDIKNIKGGSNVNLNTLQGEITTLEQSVTNLKGGSTRTIAELENDLNTDQQNITALDGRVESLETDSSTKGEKINLLESTVGNSDISNVGSSITAAIGNFTISGSSLSDSIHKLENAQSATRTVLAYVNSTNLGITQNALLLGVSLTVNHTESEKTLTLGMVIFPLYSENENELCGIAIPRNTVKFTKNTSSTSVMVDIYGFTTVSATTDSVKSPARNYLAVETAG